MPAPLLAATVVVALTAAVRSIWSPCGLSMLSTITPLTERSRGHRYWATASWFVVGAVVGGATLGAAATLPAAAVRSASPSTTMVAAVAAVLALLAAAVDSGVLGFRPPFLKRQVDDAWLSTYRPWVYGAGFGWQIGVGLSTYLMTMAVLLTIALAALTGSPAIAMAICVLFGLARGVAVFASAGATTPARLRSLHKRFDLLERPVRFATIGVQVAAAAVALAVVSVPLGLAVAATATLGALVASGAAARRSSTRRLAA